MSLKKNSFNALSDDSVSADATKWLARRDAGLSTKDLIAFEQWRAADSRHAAAFIRVSADWKRLDSLSTVTAFADEADILVQRAQMERHRRRIFRLGLGALATAAALVFAYVGWWETPKALPETYQIVASTSRTSTLPDGSVILLNGESRIETDYTTAERRVRLLQGEALFTVAKNPLRPFLVTAGGVTVRAVGTAFNVRLAPTSVEVLVTEGKVRVNDSIKGDSLLPTPDGKNGAALIAGHEDPVLTAGHRVVIGYSAHDHQALNVRVAMVAPDEMEQELAWQKTRLIFSDTPLDEVVTAFNRYNTHRLTLGDGELRSRRITGAFQADNLDGFTRLLQAGLDVKAEHRSSNETVLMPGH